MIPIVITPIRFKGKFANTVGYILTNTVLHTTFQRDIIKVIYHIIPSFVALILVGSPEPIAGVTVKENVI